MHPGDPRPLFDRHASRILARWRDHLRALPPSSALAAPELLAPLMAPALAKVRQEAAREDNHLLSPEPDPCRCGLNPLITFYLTGECATIDVMWEQPDALAPLAPAMREDLCRRLRSAWRRVATAEVSLFCSLCKRGADMEAADKHDASHALQTAGYTAQEAKALVANAPEPVACAVARSKS
ncbi:MAG: hypothetical protein MUE42_02170 [Opitutaceae bacterium]|jgi:hypothetical protein|nr:hypothetical protein [Opitutaceae bacterium]